MGLADRDYMRERSRQRQGAGFDQTRWDDFKARAEHDATWFEPKNRGFDYQKQRWRPTPIIRHHPAQKWIFLLSAVSFLFPAYREIKRAGWLPDWQETIPFPSSGSVTVNRKINPRSATSKLRVVTAAANAVVQLYDPASGVHMISVYVRKDDDVEIPVPPGTYRVQVVEGDKWHGKVKYFGSSTTTDTVVSTMTFARHASNGIDLHRRPDGNLPTRPNLFNPAPLR